MSPRQLFAAAVKVLVFAPEDTTLDPDDGGNLVLTCAGHTIGRVNLQTGDVHWQEGWDDQVA